MTGQTLFQFDVELSCYALANIAAHLDDSEFAHFVKKELPPSVLACVKALHDDGEPELLLSDEQFDDLQAAFAVDFEFDHAWQVHPWVHRGSVGCAAEIRDCLGLQAVDEWARASARFARQLEASHVSLSDGIELVHQWSRELRRLRKAMETPAPGEGKQSSDNLAAAIAETQALQREVRDLLLSQRTVKDFYTTEEVAQILGKAEFTVREWCRQGRVRADKKGSGRGKYQSWVISHAELLRIQKEGLLPPPGSTS